MNPPLRITIYPGEVIPEYTIRLVGGGIPEPGKHYTLETTVDDFGVFTTSVNPLTIISVIEMDGKEKNVHLFDGTAWIVNEDKKTHHYKIWCGNCGWKCNIEHSGGYLETKKPGHVEII